VAIEPAFAEPCFEGMETRLMLSVSLTEFNAIRAAHPDLNLSTSMSAYNIIEVGVASPDNVSSFAFSEAGLRAAIARAGITAANDLIVVRTTATQNTIALNSELVINFSVSTYGTVTIVSLGDEPLTLDAQQKSRVFSIGSSSHSPVVSLAGLEIKNGLATDNGGGIYNLGTLTVTNSIITGNTASGSFAFGGGIYSSGTLKVTSSSIAGNMASGITFAVGGGIFGDGTLTVTNSAITGNTASGVLAAQGGGICHWGDVSSTLTVTNATIAGNTVAASGANGSTAGGGLLSSGTATLANTIVVGNGTENIYGSSIVGYNNLTNFIGWASGSSGNLSYNASQPLFAAGSYRLAQNSQAIDKGSNSRASTAGLTASSKDLAGNPRIFNGTIDIGAYEYHGQPPVLEEFSGTATSSSVTLTWKAQNVVAYTLQYRVSGTTTWMTVTPAPAANVTSVTLPGLTSNTAYEFQLTATNASGSTSSIASVTTLPTPPVNFTSPSKTPNSVTLSWAAQNGLTGYTLQYRVTGTTTWQTWTSAPAANAIGATITGLTPNTGYDFQLTAKGPGGDSSPVTVNSVTTLPTAPANFISPSKTANSVTLSWTAQSGLTGYTLQYRVSGTTTWTTVTTAPAANATSATVSDLAANTSYDFQLTAKGPGGDSTPSTVNGVTTLPTAPANFASPSKTANSVMLSWTAQSGLTGYTLQYRVSGTGTWTPVTSAPAANATGATVTGLTPNTSYDFQLTAVGPGGNSSAVTVNSVITLPATPNLTCPSKTENSVTLAWAAQSGLTGYTLQYRASGTTTWQTWTPAPGPSATGTTVSGLTANTTYEFQLTAKGPGGDSVPSPILVASTNIDKPLPPANFAGSSTTPNSITLSWTTQSSLTGYTLQYRVSGTGTWQTWTPAPAASATSTTVTGLTPNTAYDFQLTATNASGSGDATTITNVATQLVPPTNFTSTGQTSNSVALAWTAQSNPTSYTLRYRVSGTTTWQTVPSAPAPNATSATVSDLTPSTSYDFQLTAVGLTAVGLADTATVTVTNIATFVAPPPPQVLDSKDRTPSSVTLEWTAQNDLSSYTLQYRVSGATTWQTWTPAPEVNDTSATITDLLANTSYDFQLTATNASGSATSPVKTVATLVVRPVAPEDFTSTAQTWNSVTLGWAPQGNLSGYTLEYRVSGTTAWQTWTPAPGTSATSATITGLLADTGYDFQLTAGNDGGSASSSISASTKVAPPIAPNLTGTATPNSMPLSWTAQSNLTSYTLEYRVSGTTTWQTWTPAPGVNDASATVTGLAANTGYDFQLTATNASGSATSPVMTVSTPVEPPIQPANFTSTDQTQNSVTLSWAAQGNLTGYTLQYRAAGTTTWQTWTPAPGVNDTSATITGLAANTPYNFQLTATNASGSATSTVLTVSTPVEPPIQPANFTSTEETQNSVTLSWTAQANLTGYTLQYKKTTESTWQTWTPAPGPSATSATITGLTAGTAYDFQLTAINASGSAISVTNATTVYEGEVDVRPLTPDSSVKAPTKFKSPNIGAQSTTLTWVASTAANADGYVVAWYIKGVRVGSMEVSGRDTTSATVDGLTAGTKYWFRVYTTTSDGKISTKWVEKPVTTKAIPSPRSVKAKADGIGAITLSWAAPKAAAMPVDMNITGYKIYDLNNNLIGSVGAGATSFRVESLFGGGTLKPNTTYSFRVVAMFEPKAGGASVESAKPVKVKGKTAKFIAPKLAAKSLTLASDITSTSITVRWQAHAGAEDFLVTCSLKKVSIDISDNMSFITDSQDNIVGVTITGLQPGVKYDFTIQATNATLNAASAILKKSVTTLKF